MLYVEDFQLGQPVLRYRHPSDPDWLGCHVIFKLVFGAMPKSRQSEPAQQTGQDRLIGSQPLRSLRSFLKIPMVLSSTDEENEMKSFEIGPIYKERRVTQCQGNLAKWSNTLQLDNRNFLGRVTMSPVDLTFLVKALRDRHKLSHVGALLQVNRLK